MPEYGRRQENQSSSRQDQQFTRCDQVAISTFLLSRRWRHIWCDIPSLTLDVDTLIAASVNETLIHYTDPKTKNLYLKATKREDIPHIDRWIKCAMPHNVENLSLDFSRKPQLFIKFNILGSSNPTAATKNVETAVFISRGGEEASMDDESDLLHMAHLPLRLRLRRCVSELSLSDESPRRREKLTEGFNLKPVSFMAQFHSSRPDCNLYAFWVRFACVDRGQTENSCCVKCPFCERFACVDRNVPWRESMSSEEFQILQSRVKDNRVTLVLCGGLLQEVYRGKQLHHLVYKRKAKQVEDFSNCPVAEAW
ncbi:hypothetical protein DY000_02037779 [Brassica cretica]|uniref:F-box domain-containing protein n=1 Tax=Brassica cretica TaxID=69181 RepID=A0ABQ7BM73_BRACR|nr:hypothetical protein DY000_02037779 [Brassica cretica]